LPSMTLFWIPHAIRSRSPQKAMTAALCSAAFCASLAPAVGVTSRKRGIT
jgi:hypothetical protein